MQTVIEVEIGCGWCKDTKAFSASGIRPDGDCLSYLESDRSLGCSSEYLLPPY